MNERVIIMVEIQKDIDWSKWDSMEDCFAKYAHVKSNLIYGKVPAEKADLSVMIPTFRRADLLKESIDSALNQKTKYSYTISVVDNDNEIDIATDELMKKYCSEHSNVVYYRNQQNIGMFGNLNRCIELSRTEWLCLLHDDDMLMENYVETLFPIANSGRYGVVGSHKKIFDQRNDADLRLNESGRSSFVAFLMKTFINVRNGNPIPMQFRDISKSVIFSSTTNLLNKNIVMEAGGYNDTYFPASDSYFFANINRIDDERIVFVPLQLYYYRIAKNESLNEITRWNAMQTEATLVQLVSEFIGLSEKQRKRNFEESVIIEYNIFVDTNKVLDIDDVIKKFNLPKKYKNKWLQRWIMMKFNLRWGLLLFRSSKAKNKG